MKQIYKISPKEIEGEYKRKGAVLSREGGRILICKREKPTARKPKNFILFVDDKGHRHYISSLYDRGETGYKFDYEGFNYVMSIDKRGKVTIKIQGYGGL